MRPNIYKSSLMSIKPEMLKEMIPKINLKTPSEKLKLIALTNQLADVYAADKHFSVESRKISFENHNKLKLLYNSALEIMTNAKQFSPEACTNLSEFFTQEELNSEEFQAPTPALAAPDHFWLGLFDKAPLLTNLITDNDREILKSLINVELFVSESDESYKLEFTFKENEYFSNPKLILEVAANSESDEIDEINSTEIQWKAGKDVRHIEIEKKQKNKKSNQVRVTKKLEKTESFFWIFKHHEPVDEDEDQDEEELGQQDPLGDGELYYNACDVVQFLKDSFFTFFIPAAYDVKIKEFEDLTMGGLEGAEDQLNKDKKDGKGEGKPECKQQ